MVPKPVPANRFANNELFPGEAKRINKSPKSIGDEEPPDEGKIPDEGKKPDEAKKPDEGKKPDPDLANKTTISDPNLVNRISNSLKNTGDLKVNLTQILETERNRSSKAKLEFKISSEELQRLEGSGEEIDNVSMHFFNSTGNFTDGNFSLLETPHRIKWFEVGRCLVSQWAGWTFCNAPCGGGIRTRQRAVAGFECPHHFETVACNEDPCDDCVVGPWTEFSPCDKKCGGGLKARQRVVLGVRCPHQFETETCNTQFC